ncbi:uncharacterized protein B0H18DRAFT_1023328, partial [Fomitopsis serialis]|uniref:uncharacterized protein n=1 Tax=Fomitopsis serialis TaxID=139415 RepID=UPI0020075845
MADVEVTGTRRISNAARPSCRLAEQTVRPRGRPVSQAYRLDGRKERPLVRLRAPSRDRRGPHCA